MNLIRAARHNAGLTLRELAEITGLAIETLSRLENNRRLPAMRTLDKISQALNIPLSNLIAYSSEDYPPPPPRRQPRVLRIRELEVLCEIAASRLAELGDTATAQVIRSHLEDAP